MSKKKATPARARKDTAARSATRNTDSAPARAPARSSNDPAVRRAAETNDTAQAMPFNAGKSAEYSDSAADIEPVEGQHVPAPELITGSTLSETNVSDKTGAAPSSGENPTNGPLTRVRVSSDGQRLTTNQGVPIADNQNSLKAGLRGPALLEGLHPAREDHALRPRAHSGAHRSRARLRCARLLRMLRVAVGPDARRALPQEGQAHAGLCALLDRRGRARLEGYGARRARLRRQVLYGGRQLGSRRQQHARCSSSRMR